MTGEVEDELEIEVDSTTNQEVSLLWSTVGFELKGLKKTKSRGLLLNFYKFTS